MSQRGSNGCNTKFRTVRRLEEVYCIKFLGSQVSAHGGREMEVIHEEYNAWRPLKSVLSNRGFGINAKKDRGMGTRSAVRRKMNFLKDELNAEELLGLGCDAIT